MNATNIMPLRKYKTTRERIREMAARKVDRIKTGIKTLDDATGGMQFGTINTIIGAPGACKTGWVLSLLYQFAQEGVEVAVLCPDQQAHQLLVRLGQMTGLDRRDLEDGAVSKQLESNLSDIVDHIHFFEPHNDDVKTVEDAGNFLLSTDAKRLVLIVDSIQTVKSSSWEKGDDRYERINKIVECFKQIEKSGVMIIAISEMARGGYRHKNSSQNISALAAGKESGEIEYAVSGVLMGLRPVDEDHGLFDVEVAKNRLGNGSKPTFRMRLNFERSTLSEEVILPEKTIAQKVLELVRAKDGAFKSANAILKELGGNRKRGLEAVEQLESLGLLGKDSNGFYTTMKDNDDEEKNQTTE